MIEQKRTYCGKEFWLLDVRYEIWDLGSDPEAMGAFWLIRDAPEEEYISESNLIAVGELLWEPVEHKVYFFNLNERKFDSIPMYFGI